MLHSHTSGFGKDLPQTERLLQLRIVGLQVDFPPPRTTGRLHNFPARTTTLIRREHEIDVVKTWLTRSEVRFVSLTGLARTAQVIVTSR